MNELIFFGAIIGVSLSNLFFLRLGKGALIALIALQCVLANLFVTKEIELFGFTATASDVLGVGGALTLNLIQEYFGRPIAQQSIWISFFCTLFYTAASIVQLSYLPAPTDMNHSHFIALLSPMPRIVIASIFVYLLTQHLDCILYGYFGKKFGKSHFILKNYSSLFITQLVDTVLFSFLGLYMINESFATLKVMFDICVISYIIKMSVVLIAAPFIATSKKMFAPLP